MYLHDLLLVVLFDRSECSDFRVVQNITVAAAAMFLFKFLFCISDEEVALCY